MQEREVVLCHSVRTAMGAFNGTLKATPAIELGAAACCFQLSQVDHGQLPVMGVPAYDLLRKLR